MGKQWKQWETILVSSKSIPDSDCSHKIKRCLLLGRKAMTNLDSKVQTLLCQQKCLSSQSYGFSSSHLWMWELVLEEGWALKKDAFQLWCWRRLLRVPWAARGSNHSTLKEISPEYSLEGLRISWNSNTLATWCQELTHLKRPWCWERLKAGGEGDDREWDGWMASPTNGYELGQAPGDGEERWSLACCTLWSLRE